MCGMHHTRQRVVAICSAFFRMQKKIATQKYMQCPAHPDKLPHNNRTNDLMPKVLVQKYLYTIYSWALRKSTDHAGIIRAAMMHAEP